MVGRIVRRSLALFIVALGLALVIGGLRLLLLDGSSYYALCGGALIVSGALLWRGHRWGTRLYWLILLVTAAWALFEVGLHPWGLAVRLGLLTIVGVFLFLAGHSLHHAVRRPLAPEWIVIAIVAIILVMAGAWLIGPSAPRATVASSSAEISSTDWNVYGGNRGGTRFSALTQITPANVAELEQAWTFHTGDLSAGGPEPIDALGGLKGLYGVSGFQATPLQVGDTLYTCSERNMALALDADSGVQRWRFDPQGETAALTHSSCRGVAYHEQPSASGLCATRILHGSLDGRLWALDAKSGQPCPEFGEQGSVSLREGLSNPEIGYHMTAPGTVAKGVVVVGAWIPDNQSVTEPSGVVRAYDVVSGALVWAWDMGQPDRRGAPPPGETYTPGTPNVWSFGSVDESLNLIYLPTGNASPDLWGGSRRIFDDQYSSSVVALDLTTGRPRWSFQTTHHDLWDYDVPAQPLLFDLPAAGGVRPWLIQATKPGEIFILDRRTGEPIVPVVERPVPQGAAVGDRLAPTQPFSELSVRPPDLSEAQMWGITPLDQLWCRIRFREARYEGIYTPPGERPTINFPGSFGAISWGGLAVDEQRQLLISNKTSVAYYMQLIPRDQAPESARRRRDPTSYQWLPMEQTPYVARIRPFVSPLSIPCNQPPWGHLQAIDLQTNRTLWKRSIGTARDSGPWGIATRLPLPIGTPTQGGAISTASGLTFIAATADNYLRAFETQTGKELWRARLPAGGQATPMTYRSPKSGRQYVVISAGGHSGMKTRRGDFLVAFALPRG